MKKCYKVITVVLFYAFCVALFCFCAITFYIYNHPVVGKSNDDGTIVCDGTTYYSVQTPSTDVCVFNKDKYRGNLDSSIWGLPVYTIKYDNNNYICVSHWDGNMIYSSKKEEQIRRGNKITAIYLGAYAEYRITNEIDCQILLSLDTISGESYSYLSESSGKFSISIYGCYDNSAFATEWIGTIAHKDNKWIFVSDEQICKALSSIMDNRYTYTGVIINNATLIKELERITSHIDRLNG